MTIRFQIYAVLITASIIYNLIKEDLTGVVLSTLVLPMCFLGGKREEK